MKKLFCLFALLLGVVSASGQTMATGVYPFSSFDQPGFDSINLSNLNVHFSIPLVSRTGRGQGFNYALNYEGLVWTPVASGGSSTWSLDPTAGFTGVLNGTSFTGYVTHRDLQIGCPRPPHWSGPVPPAHNLNNFVYHDPYGGTHKFNYGVTGACPLSDDEDQPYGDGSTNDNSGYSLINGYQVQTSSGFVIDPALSANGQDSTSMTDRNGNVISSNGSTFQDTLGVNALVIGGAGTAASPRTFSYPVARQTNSQTTTAQATLYYHTYNVNTNFQCGVTEYGLHTVDLPDRLTLADGVSTYSFTYEPMAGATNGEVTARLASITLPTGGTITYHYNAGCGQGMNADGTVGALTRTTTDGTRTYNRSSINSNATSTTLTDEANNQTTFSFTFDAGTGRGFETHRNAYQGNSSSGALTDFYTCYNGANPGCDGQSISLPITSVASLKSYNGGVQDLTRTNYTANGYLTSVTNAAGLVTSYTYNSDGGLLSQTTVDGSGNQVSSLTNGYDESSPISTSNSIPQHNAVSSARNNLTSSHVATGSGTLDTTIVNYDTGVPSTITSNGATVTLSYDATQGFVTQTTTSASSGGSTLSTGATYDPTSAALFTSTDMNGNNTSVDQYDALMRPLHVTPPAGGGASTLSYSPNQVGTTQQMNANSTMDAETFYDTYGRVSRKALKNDTGWYLTDSCYTPTGQIQYQTLPYAAANTSGSSGCNSQPHITYSFDAIGRPTGVSYPDGKSTGTVYKNRSVKTVDENGVTKVQTMDLVGRLSAVCEVTDGTNIVHSGTPGVCESDFNSTGFLTTYSYDDAHHKITVAQSVNDNGNAFTQNLYFQTDQAGRTILETEPERGDTKYSYAYNGTGLQVIRNRLQANQNGGNTTNTATQYDLLGRILSVTYGDGTPSKQFFYDEATAYGQGNGQSLGSSKGQMTRYSTSSGTATVLGYDNMGRVNYTAQCFPTTCSNGTLTATRFYGYDLAGNRISEMYPSPGNGQPEGINKTYSVAGELTGMNATGPDFVGSYYANGALVSSVQQSPYGPTQFLYGNGLTGKRLFDALGRPQEYDDCVGNSYTNCRAGSRMAHSGNRVTAVSGLVNPTYSSTITYDALNRLTGVSYPGANTAIAMQYDRFGNRWSQTYTQGSGTTPLTTYDLAHNQVQAPTAAYDAAGNMTAGGGRNYTYDAEGNVTQVGGGVSASYVYDAMNRRVQVQEGNYRTLYAFDLDGHHAMTYDRSGTNSPTLTGTNAYWGNRLLATYTNNRVYFQHVDVLGSISSTTDYTGGLVGTFATMPFGELQSNGAQGTVYTDPEHFGELDYDRSSDTHHATFRQYSSLLGRWMSPDPYSGSYDASDPQSLNRYSYVENNPFGFLDPDGLDYGYDCGANCVGVVATPDPPYSSWGPTPGQFGGLPWWMQEYGGPGCTNGVAYSVLTGCTGPGPQPIVSAPAPKPAPAPNKVTCSTMLPNGRTVGSYVQQYRSQLQSISDASGVDDQQVGSTTGAFYSISQSNGPIDFKNIFRGQANAAMLGQAGNFAYYAIGSGILPNFELDAGAGAYAVYSAIRGRKPFSSLTGPWFSDASAASVRSQGLAAGGCGPS